MHQEARDPSPEQQARAWDEQLYEPFLAKQIHRYLKTKKEKEMEPNKFLRYNAGGQFHLHLPQRPDSGTVTASLYLPSGGSNGTGSVIIDNASSTVTNAATVGATSLNIGSTTNFKIGHKYIVGNADPENYTAEVVHVKAKTANTISLLRPLLFQHSNGDAIGGSQVDITLTQEQTQVMGKGHRVEISYSVSGSLQPVLTEDFSVTRYYPISQLTTEAIRDFDPTLSKKLPSGISFEDLKNSTWGMILDRIGANYSAGSLVGTLNLTTAHQYLFRAIIAEGAGPDQIETAKMYRERFQEEFNASMAAATFDANGDGATNQPNDKYYKLIRLVRG